MRCFVFNYQYKANTGSLKDILCVFRIANLYNYSVVDMVECVCMYSLYPLKINKTDNIK